MSRIIRCVLWATALTLLTSCAAKKESVVSSEPVPPVSSPPAPAPEPDLSRIEVIQMLITENQEYVNVKVRIKENELNTLDPSDVYLLDEASGKKYPVVRLQRIGKLAEFSVPGEKGVRRIMFWNNEGGLKIGKVVTLKMGKYQKKSIRIR